MGTRGYSDQAREILEDAYDAKRAADTIGSEGGRVMNPPLSYTPSPIPRAERHRNATPERLDIARTALEHAGYSTIVLPDGSTIYVPTGRTYTRESFAWLTPMSGDEPLAINPRHVESVETAYRQAPDGLERYASVTLQSGETLCIRGTAEETVAQLQAVAA